ncbi:hypothetical protein [Pantoea sp. BAV 3049]|uniref:hypothetical protein n=1 Tax=Pantoea sp. BAV 3049 TaxID=2654188 RepID=UPI00131C489D|nr:hypothetical protein [Pantoea sp. BAV 3049]
MKKLLKLLWDDFIDDIIVAYIPVASIIAFSIIAMIFWPKYAWESIIFYIILIPVGLYFYRKKHPNLNPFSKNKK